MEIKPVGNYLKCPFCGKLFGNGISIVYSNIVMDCTCSGMRRKREMMRPKEASIVHHIMKTVDVYGATLTPSASPAIS